MDKIQIQNLEIYAHHGVFSEETFLGQKFLISMILFLDTRKAGKTDDLSKSVSYADICKFVETLFVKENYKLIETCAEKVAESILLAFPLIRKIDICIKKPWAPIGSHLDYVAVEIQRQWHKAYLGLGSNLGNKKKNLETAIQLLSSDTTKVKKISQFYETKPVGYTQQDDFLNCVLEIETLLPPSELMDYVLEIEKELKRERTIHWGPRTLDIDILLYDNLISEEEHVLLPHPRMTERLFVLVPLAEIAPFAIHPLTHQPILFLKEKLEKENPDF